MSVIRNTLFKMPVKDISFCSYNLKDFGDNKFVAVRELFNNCTFMLLQETWLNDIEFIRRFKDKISKFSECISANKMDLADYKGGRRYGGVSICHHSNIKTKV